MLHGMTFIMAEATSCWAQLDPETFIYIGGDTRGVSWLPGKNNTVSMENKDIRVNGGCMNQG